MFQSPPEPDDVPSVEVRLVVDDPSDDAEPQRPAGTEAESLPDADPLLVRQAFCSEPKALRRERIADLADNDNIALQLDRLLLMSCEMHAFLAPIEASLAALAEVSGWSASHRAMFELLKDSATTLRAVEARRYALQVQLEDTIQGITHIEEAIDARREAGDLAED